MIMMDVYKLHVFNKDKQLLIDLSQFLSHFFQISCDTNIYELFCSSVKTVIIDKSD